MYIMNDPTEKETWTDTSWLIIHSE